MGTIGAYAARGKEVCSIVDKNCKNSPDKNNQDKNNSQNTNQNTSSQNKNCR